MFDNIAKYRFFDSLKGLNERKINLVDITWEQMVCLRAWNVWHYDCVYVHNTGTLKRLNARKLKYFNLINWITPDLGLGWGQLHTNILYLKVVIKHNWKFQMMFNRLAVNFILIQFISPRQNDLQGWSPRLSSMFLNLDVPCLSIS